MGMFPLCPWVPTNTNLRHFGHFIKILLRGFWDNSAFLIDIDFTLSEQIKSANADADLEELRTDTDQILTDTGRISQMASSARIWIICLLHWTWARICANARGRSKNTKRIKVKRAKKTEQTVGGSRSVLVGPLAICKWRDLNTGLCHRRIRKHDFVL